MYRYLTLFFVIMLVLSCENSEKSTSETMNLSENSSTKAEKFGIVIHGGAGTILKEHMGDSLESAYREKLKEAISVGYEILKNGGTSIDAVTHTINVMEDSPLLTRARAQSSPMREKTNWTLPLWRAQL